ncbi:MAG: hypothetical protein WDZ26_03260 [Nitriliruptoraceae bacterium]
MGRDAVESAYFTLLRAREELDGLHRCGEYLAEEQRRIRRYQRESAALADTVDRRLRWGIRHTDTPLARAFEDRLEALADELERLPARVVAAASFVEECERAHAELSRGA